MEATNSSSAVSISTRWASVRFSSPGCSFLEAAPIAGKPKPPFLALALAASSVSRAFSTSLRAFCANEMLVLSVVAKAELKRETIWASCCSRASPTCSDASAYFSSAVASGSLGSRRCDDLSDARPSAWLNVLGAALEPGFVSAAWASAADEAEASSWTFSETVRERSRKLSRCAGGGGG